MRVPVGGGHVQLRLDLLRDALVVRNSFEMRSELTEFYGVRFDGVQVEGNRLDGVRVDSVRLKASIERRRLEFDKNCEAISQSCGRDEEERK